MVGFGGRISLGNDAADEAADLGRDGDLVGLIQRMIYSRGIWTVCISKVKGHADEDLVRQGQVRELDRDRNHRADGAAVFGGVGLALMSLMLGVIFLVCVGGGTSCSGAAQVLHCYLLWCCQ